MIDHGGLGEYYDVQGTTWSEPPLLGNPTEQIPVGSRHYSLYYDGEHIKTIAWHEDGGTYWIENTLTNGLSPQEMVTVAQQTNPCATRLDGARPGGHVPSTRGMVVPSRRTAREPRRKDRLGGCVPRARGARGALGALVRRRRELKDLHAQVSTRSRASRRGASRRRSRPASTSAREAVVALAADGRIAVALTRGSAATSS